MPIIWTQALREATSALFASRSYAGIHESRVSLMRDVQSRAREINQGLAVGQALTPLNVEYVNLMRSRLGDFDLADLPAVKAFNAAWGDAWDAAR